MGILFWRKNAKKIDAFARAGAEELYSHVSPEEAAAHFAGESETKTEKQRTIESRINAVILQMNDFSREHNLGVYGKARLQKQFSDRLIELGYDAQTTRQLVRAILYRKLA